MCRIIPCLILLVILVVMSAGPTPSILAQPPTCPDLVNTAFQVVDLDCEDTGNNQACYAHARIDAIPQAHVRSLAFDQAGDIADVTDLQSLHLSPMDLNNSWWGVSLIRLRTNAPNTNARENASLLLFGNVSIENAVQTPTVRRELTIHTTAGASARVRIAPYDGLVIAALPDGQTVTATGRTDDGWWVRIELPDTERPGWVHANLLAETDTIADLESVESDAARYASMQAFTFTSGQDDAVCSEAPNSGLVIQTPEGEAKVTFLVNEVDIQLGSTVFLQAVPGKTMSIYLIEGSSRITARGVSYAMVAGTVITVPLDDAGIAAGPPSLPTAYDLADLMGLPVNHLDRVVVIAPPLDATALAQLIASYSNSSSTSTDTTDQTTASVPQSGDPSVPDVPGAPSAPDAPSVPSDPGAPDVPSEPEPPAPEDHKIIICHKGNTIEIDESAWPAHQAHGDTLGPCLE